MTTLQTIDSRRILQLDLDTDPHALCAARAYAVAAAKAQPELAAQLNAIANEKIGQEPKR